MGRSYLIELEPDPSRASHTTASRRVSHLLQLSGGDTYLKIGLANGETLQADRARQRTAVDPCPVFAVDRLPPDCKLHPVSSDAFFASLFADWRTDAILVNALHQFRRSYRDLCSSLAYPSPRGFVLIDDTVSTEAVTASPDQDSAIRLPRQTGLAVSRPWMGDVFKVICPLKTFHSDLENLTMLSEGRPQTVVWQQRPGTAPVVPSQDLSEIDALF